MLQDELYAEEVRIVEKDLELPLDILENYDDSNPEDEQVT
jgi:hypothetical protein